MEMTISAASNRSHNNLRNNLQANYNSKENSNSNSNKDNDNDSIGKKRHPSRLTSLSRLSTTHRVILMSVLLWICLLPLYVRWTAADTTRRTWTHDDLEALVNDLRGDDFRIVLWDAAVATADKQEPVCGTETLRDVVSLLRPRRTHTHGTNTTTRRTTVLSTEEDTIRLALELVTFCVTDNRQQRDHFAHAHRDIHAHILHHVASRQPLISAAAAHVVYITSFAHTVNHQAYIALGAVDVLSHVVLLPPQDSLTVQVMWAAAALQNLAASYCATPDDGRCYWEWPDVIKTSDAIAIDRVAIGHDSLPLISDGTRARQQIQRNDALVERLIELSCAGPVPRKESTRNPYPGHKAETPRDTNHTNLLAWAATGALKNLALEPSAQSLLEPHVPCFCYLSHSKDWLEANKGGGILHHMRRGDPCWFDRQHVHVTCVDDPFVDLENYACADYGDATEEECHAASVGSGVLARDTCCGCGGGRRLPTAGHLEL
jgi:hypothetical protein